MSDEPPIQLSFSTTNNTRAANQARPKKRARLDEIEAVPDAAPAAPRPAAGRRRNFKNHAADSSVTYSRPAGVRNTGKSQAGSKATPHTSSHSTPTLATLTLDDTDYGMQDPVSLYPSQPVAGSSRFTTAIGSTTTLTSGLDPGEMVDSYGLPVTVAPARADDREGFIEPARNVGVY